jgi:diguanylate cyclase (GGDEF)-like protein/putative nucleotidyltransferase with HDIG domain
MSKLTLPAQLYILGVVAAGGALTAWQLSCLPPGDYLLALVVGLLAALAQLFKVEGPTERSSYNISWVAYGFAFMVLGAPGVIWVILLAHLVEWVKHRYPWFIQSFNVAQFALAASAAMLVGDWTRAALPGPLAEALAIAAASVTFTGLNHWLIGVVLKLARGQSFKESGVFERLTLAIDFTLFGLGVVGAFIWRVNPFAAVLALVPLYLIYTTLRVPALQRQTQIDAKTGLFNSKYFTQALESELARADRYDRPLTVVMADLDLLRNINNSYGHLAGDACLIAVARLLKNLVRDYDIVARFGGEEFAILMSETTAEEAYPRIEEIRAAIEAARIEVSTSTLPLRVTMSFGIASRTSAGQSANSLIHQADLAVYQAKLSGRNRICRQTPNSELSPQPPSLPVGASTEGAGNGTSLADVTPPNAAPPLPEPARMEEAKPVTGPVVRPRPAWAINAYIAALAAVAGGLSLWSSPALPAGWADWLGLAFFAILVILAEGLAIEIYVRDTVVSTAVAPMIAGALLFGPTGAIVLSLAVAAVSWVKHRSPWNRFVFNAANHSLSGMVSVATFTVVERFMSAWLGVEIAHMVGAVLAGGLVYLSSTGLLALAIDLSTGQPCRHVWLERFRWLGPYYLTLGMIGFGLAVAFQLGGLVGVLVILAPLLVLRYSQVQYLDHTKTLVAQLRRSNTELQQHAREITQLNEELLLALSHAVDLRDPDVQDHSKNVARYATLIAQELNLPPERVELVRKAGLLHDIGKLGIPETILFKPARLTATEYDIIKQHSDMGADIVAEAHSLQAIVPFIRHHHERFDGQGYPAGLPGPEIPLEARILSVADTVEAMASDRPYRRAQSPADILAEIQNHAGTQFDPTVVNAFVKVVKGAGEAIIVNSSRTAALLHYADALHPRREALVLA